MEQVEYTLKENITNKEHTIIIEALNCYFVRETDLVMKDDELWDGAKVGLTFDLNNQLITIKQKFEIKE
jgi:hypothetical protein